MSEAIMPPAENIREGLLGLDIAELGDPYRGKVRDTWLVDDHVHGPVRVLVTTDRQSAYDNFICTVPGKGAILNTSSEYWFGVTDDIFPNHAISVPHPNVLIAADAERVIPVELVVRRYMAQSSTRTSIDYNYSKLGRRRIYGIDFPDGIMANEELPMGTIVTPTTKAQEGHDEELTDIEARDIVDQEFGKGTWDRVQNAAIDVFERGRAIVSEQGLILVDTKYEFGFTIHGDLMLIDEVHTPDSSRFWLADTYEERFRTGASPDRFDKDILRRWLASRGFTGEGQVPVVDRDVIDQMAASYEKAYRMITGKTAPQGRSDAGEIKDAILDSLNI